jgi:hypothetical protein
MDQPGAEAVGFLGQNAGCQGIDGPRQFGFRLGLVDCRMGGRVDNHIWRDSPDAGNQAGEIGEIAAQVALTLAVEGNDLTERRQAALQLPANLSAFAEKQDSHGWRSP